MGLPLTAEGARIRLSFGSAAAAAMQGLGEVWRRQCRVWQPRQLRSRPDQRLKAGIKAITASLGRGTSFGDLLQYASQYLDFERW
jgi:hypothetical protein